jgi:heme-degrading monooxygenase HmoA
VSIVEVTTFRLAEGVTDESFLALDRRLQTELVPNQPGFLRRTTARQGDSWLVVTLWSTEEDAVAFQRVAEAHPLQAEFEHAAEPGSLRRDLYATLD